MTDKKIFVKTEVSFALFLARLQVLILCSMCDSHFENKYEMSLGQTETMLPFLADKGLCDPKPFSLKCACETPVQTSGQEAFCRCSQTVIRMPHTHQELGSSLVGLHAYLQHTGLKNKHEEKRGRGEQKVKKKIDTKYLSFL